MKSEKYFEAIRFAAGAVFIVSGCLLYMKHQPKDIVVVEPTCEATHNEVIQTIPQGMCRFYVRMYGSNSVMTLSSGDCFMAMSALSGRSLEVDILREPNKGEAF